MNCVDKSCLDSCVCNMTNIRDEGDDGMRVVGCHDGTMSESVSDCAPDSVQPPVIDAVICQSGLIESMRELACQDDYEEADYVDASLRQDRQDGAVRVIESAYPVLVTCDHYGSHGVPVACNNRVGHDIPVVDFECVMRREDDEHSEVGIAYDEGNRDGSMTAEACEHSVCGYEGIPPCTARDSAHPPSIPGSEYFVTSCPSAEGRFVLGGAGRDGRRGHLMTMPRGRASGPYLVSMPSGCARGPYLVSAPNAAGTAFSKSFLLSRPPAGLLGGGSGGVGSLLDASGAEWNNWAGVYVLEKPGGEFYVGKSGNIGERIRQHMEGSGASCARGGMRRVAPMTPAISRDLEAWERAETLARMREHGISKVRGWMYTSPVLTDAEREHAFQQVCERHDLCRRCGLGGHFAARCRVSKQTRPWWAR
jgi:hypothetical protein